MSVYYLLKILKVNYTVRLISPGRLAVDLGCLFTDFGETNSYIKGFVTGVQHSFKGGLAGKLAR